MIASGRMKQNLDQVEIKRLERRVVHLIQSKIPMKLGWTKSID
jgi:hypothetical protein